MPNSTPLAETTPPPTAKFDVDASVIFQLGESLITDGYQALAELIKNSYDADALQVTVDINPVGEDGQPKDPTGLITVTDNGNGMTEAVIRNAWLTVSNSPKRTLKAANGKTPKGRVPLGDKGLGRLGVQRLGRIVEIETRPVAADGQTLLQEQYYVRFSWEDFRQSKKLSDVQVTLEPQTPTRSRGTTIRISGLYEPEIWHSSNAKELADSLSQLVSPYEAIKDFDLTVKLEGEDLELASLGAEVERSAIVHYDLTYEKQFLAIDGKAKLGFFRPPPGDDLDLFRQFVEADKGATFLQYLLSQKGASSKYGLEKADGTWYVRFSSKYPLDEIVAVPVTLKKTTAGTNGEANQSSLVKVDPGRFRGEVDGFNLREGELAPSEALREYLKVFSGVRVFRDGFAIRGERDWLNLSRESTYGKSYYSLRPWNTLGYIALTAEHNAGLIEKTDREGFQKNPQYDAFAALLSEYVKFMGEVQSFLRRSWTKFRATALKEAAAVPVEITAATISRRFSEHFTRAATIKNRFENSTNELTSGVDSAWKALQKSLSPEALNKVTDKRTRAALSEVKSLVAAAHERVGKAKTLLSDVDVYLDQTSKLEPSNAIIRDRFAAMEERVEEIYDIASLGLTAETLSHEIANLSDKLAARTSIIAGYVNESYPRDRKLTNYISFIGTSVNGLRKQLSHLSPALRYAREKKESLDMVAFITDLAVFHKERLDREHIQLFVKEVSKKDFRISFNRGKLSQVFDNLILNSEYWIREQIRTHEATSGTIRFEVDYPVVRIMDSGPGVLSRLEEVLFEPFESGKPKGKGRGLGLYIARQLLAGEGCTIELAQQRNSNGRRFVFEVNFADVVVNG